MQRRDLLTRAPLALAAVAVPALPSPGLAQETERERMIRVIEQLEASQGWEASGIVAAKAFAAWQMRKAIGLALPDPQTAQQHIEYQQQQFKAYRRSFLFERDQAAGKHYQIAAVERALA